MIFSCFLELIGCFLRDFYFEEDMYDESEV